MLLTGDHEEGAGGGRGMKVPPNVRPREVLAFLVRSEEDATKF